MNETAQAFGDEREILYTVEDGIAILSLNRPTRSNAQTYPLLYALDEAFTCAVDDDEVKAIILRGEGKHFSAGHDVATADIQKWSRGSKRRSATPCAPRRETRWWA